MCNRIESVTGILGWPQCLAAGWQNSPFVQRNDCIKLIGKRSIHSIRAMSWIYCRALFNLTPEKTITPTFNIDQFHYHSEWHKSYQYLFIYFFLFQQLERFSKIKELKTLMMWINTTPMDNCGRVITGSIPW